MRKMVIAALLSTTGLVQAQEYPSDTITMQVGYSAGGQADALARAVANAMQERLEQTVVVENRPGANGLLAAQSVAGSEADGYNILLVTDAMVTIEPQLAESQQWEPQTYLAPVIDLADGPLYIAVNTSTVAATVSDLVAQAKADGTTLSFGTSGTATPHRMAGEALGQAGGVPVKHVAYQGTSASITDLAGGQITMAIGASTAIQPLIDAGRVKLLATTGAERSRLLPDVPAVAETYPGYDFGTYFGVMVPEETPEAVVTKLNATLNEILEDPAVIQSLEQLGVTANGGTATDFQARIDADFETRGAAMAELGLTAQ